MANASRRDRGSRKRVRRSRGEPGRGNVADVALTGELDERRDSNEMGHDPDVKGRPRENLDETLGHDLDDDRDIER